MEANTAPESDEAMNPNEQRTMNTNGHPNGQDDTTSARIQTFRFPGSTIGTVCQTGTQLGDRHAGVTVELHFRDKHDNRPQCAEVYGGEHYAEIGLEWDEDTLVGSDGAFELPMEVVACVERLGFNVEDCEPDSPRPLSEPQPLFAVSQTFETLGDPCPVEAVSWAQAMRAKTAMCDSIAWMIAALDPELDINRTRARTGMVGEIEAWAEATRLASHSKRFGLVAGTYLASRAVVIESV